MARVWIKLMYWQNLAATTTHQRSADMNGLLLLMPCCTILCAVPASLAAEGRNAVLSFWHGWENTTAAGPGLREDGEGEIAAGMSGMQH
ncbi:hypothetical protein CC78DRAFT_614734 [Lojkania enalia]|uniref:Secreted protein n=1 Tax=Lojkania enalia TaxID=147567 RepID=A0A9P4KIE8_9PLEO|nr:hypothetical protein CC78DRAFT_614734 [Didymosphaeria enalia]